MTVKLLTSCLLLCACHVGAGGDTTPPSITIGLADATNMGKMFPMPDGGVISPVNGIVWFRAELRDGGSGITSAMIIVPRASSYQLHSHSPRSFIGAKWDVRRLNTGARASITVSCRDAAGNLMSETVNVTLKK